MAVNPKIIKLTGSFTRPTNTTAYAAEDSVCNSTTAPALITLSCSEITLALGQSLLIKSVKLSKSTNTTTNASFRLWMLDETQTAINDNDAQTLLATNSSKRVGLTDHTLTTGGTGSDCAESLVTDVNALVRLKSANLYGHLVAKAAYTPGNAEVFTVEVIAHLLDYKI